MKILNHKFVENIPKELEEGILYVSIQYEIAIHKCCCGCGNEVVTPISPTDWTIIFNGEAVTLEPSIGSWSLECQSHYFIRKNKVIWSNSYNTEEIKRVRRRDSADKTEYYKDNKSNIEIINENIKKVKEKKSLWKKLFTRWFR